jgi:hypothetical protein
MADLGTRGNVMGPQPIGRRNENPPEMTATAEQVLELMLAGKSAELVRLAMPACSGQMAEFAASVPPGKCSSYEVIALAHVNRHYYVKARLTAAEPVTVQFRLGEHEGRWMVWEVINLTGRRGAWTR